MLTFQCTSPFIQPDFLETGYKMVLQGYDSVFSVTRLYTYKRNIHICKKMKRKVLMVKIQG